MKDKFVMKVIISDVLIRKKLENIFAIILKKHVFI